MKVIDVTISQRWLRQTVHFNEEGQTAEAFPLPGFNIPFLDRTIDLWSHEANSKFEATFAGTGIAQSLDKRMYNIPKPLVLRIGASDASQVPWEGFQRLVDASNRRKLAPVRLIRADRAFRFATPNAPMRCLALVGHPGSPPKFRAIAARKFLQEALDAAAAASGGHLTSLVLELREDNLTQAAQQTAAFEPNVVLYFGHGQQSNGPQILLSERTWTPLEELVERLFPPVVSAPLFWIFWACSLAEEPQPVSDLGRPETIKALEASGALAMLAMRSRIRVGIARPMLEVLIEALAAGEPLEVAAAHSRAVAAQEGHYSSKLMDYAAPAVWSLSEPVERIRWNGSDEVPLSWLIVPLLSNADRFPEFEHGMPPIGDQAKDLAALWMRPGAHFALAEQDVMSDLGAEALLFSAAAHLRATTGRPVVPVMLRDAASFERRLSNWAKSAHARLDPRYVNSGIASAISRIADRDHDGLAQLLSIPGIILILSSPPDNSRAWEELSSPSTDTTIVVIGTTVPPDATRWKSEHIMPPGAPVDLNAVVSATPLGCAILSVIERPISFETVGHLASAPPSSLIPLDPLLITIGGKKVLPESVRMEIRSQLSQQQIEQGRRACIKMLEDLPLEFNFNALVEVLHHYVALNEDECAAEAINAAWRVTGGRWDAPQRLQLLPMIARREALRDALDEPVILDIAGAAIVMQDTSLVHLVLAARRPLAMSNLPRWHSMMAECLKAKPGGRPERDAMRRHAESALRAARDGVAEGKFDALEILHFQHDLARIHQYFDHNYSDASRDYEEIRTQLSESALTNKRAAHLFAAATRNLAECILDPAGRPVDGPVFQRIENLLHEGIGVAGAQGLTQVELELVYTRARLYEAAGNDIAAASFLLDLSNGDAGLLPVPWTRG